MFSMYCVSDDHDRKFMVYKISNWYLWFDLCIIFYLLIVFDLINGSWCWTCKFAYWHLGQLLWERRNCGFFFLLQPHNFDLCWKIYLNSCMLLILVVYCMPHELQFLNSNIYESYRWWWSYWGFAYWRCKDNLLQLGNSSPPDAFNYYLMRMFAGTS